MIVPLMTDELGGPTLAKQAVKPAGVNPNARGVWDVDWHGVSHGGYTE